MRGRPFGWFRLAWQKLLLAVSAPDATQSTLTNSSFTGASGTLTYTARDSSGTLLSDVPVVFTVDAEALVSAGSSVVTASPATIANDALDNSVITLALVDTDSDPVVGFAAASMVLASTGTGNTVTQPSAVTDVTGQASGSLVSTVAEAKTVSAAAASLAITDTAPVVVSGTPSDLHPNEPVGATMFADADGTVEESAGDAFGITWLGAWTVDGSAPAGNLAVVADATNPQGSGSALRFIFDQTYNPRCAQVTGTFPDEKATLYISLRIKFNDNFGPKMYYIGLPSVAGSADLYIDRGTDGRIRLVRQAISNLELIDTSEAAPKGSSSTPFTVGSWHHIEVVLEAESAPSAADGTVTMWCNDTQVGSATGVEWGGNFGSLEWYGDINTVTGTPSYQIGELYLSGVNA